MEMPTDVQLTGATLSYKFPKLQRWFACSYLCRFFSFVVSWTRYNVCICTSAAFVSSLVTSYHLVNYVLVDFLTTYFTDSLDTPSGRPHLLLIAATLKNIHGGLTATFEIILIFISDSHIGPFKTVLFSSASYVIGLTVLGFWERTPYSERQVFDIIAIFYLAIGCAGWEPLREFLSDQLRAKESNTEHIDEDRVKARTRLWSRATWFISAVVSIVVFGNWGWSKICFSSASAMAISCLVFFCGIFFYHWEEATSAKHIFISNFLFVKGFFKNCHRRINHLPESDGSNGTKDIESSIGKEEKEETSSFHPVTQLWALKPDLMFMLPTWGFSITLGIGLSTANSFFPEQGNDLKPPFYMTALLLLQDISGRVISYLYDIIVSKWKPTDGEQRKDQFKMVKIWIGELLLVVCLLVGWQVETYRHNLKLWLALQFFLSGAAKTLAKDGLNDLISDHLPDSLEKYGLSLNEFVISGLGNFFSIIVLQSVPSWFPYDLSSSHLNKHYVLVAILNFINLCFSILWTFYKGMDGCSVEEPPESQQSLEMVVIQAK